MRCADSKYCTHRLVLGAVGHEERVLLAVVGLLVAALLGLALPREVDVGAEDVVLVLQWERLQ